MCEENVLSLEISYRPVSTLSYLTFYFEKIPNLQETWKDPENNSFSFLFCL